MPIKTILGLLISIFVLGAVGGLALAAVNSSRGRRARPGILLFILALVGVIVLAPLNAGLVLVQPGEHEIVQLHDLFGDPGPLIGCTSVGLSESTATPTITPIPTLTPLPTVVPTSTPTGTDYIAGPDLESIEFITRMGVNPRNSTISNVGEEELGAYESAIRAGIAAYYEGDINPGDFELVHVINFQSGEDFRWRIVVRAPDGDYLWSQNEDGSWATAPFTFEEDASGIRMRPATLTIIPGSANLTPLFTGNGMLVLVDDETVQLWGAEYRTHWFNPLSGTQEEIPSIAVILDQFGGALVEDIDHLVVCCGTTEDAGSNFGRGDFDYDLTQHTYTRQTIALDYDYDELLANYSYELQVIGVTEPNIQQFAQTMTWWRLERGWTHPIAVSRDGNAALLWAYDQYGDSHSLLWINGDSPQGQIIASFPQSAWVQEWQVSPDADMTLITVYDGDDDVRFSYYVVNLQDGSISPVQQRDVIGDTITHEFNFPSGGGVIRDSVEPNAMFNPRLSPDGTRIVYSSTNDLWITDIAGESHEHFLEMDFIDYPDWSSDSSQLAFNANYYELYVVNSDGTGLRQVMASGDPVSERWQPRWVPNPGDPRIIVHGGDGPRGLYIVNLFTETIETLLPRSSSGAWIDTTSYRFSPGGDWVIVEIINEDRGMQDCLCSLDFYRCTCLDADASTNDNHCSGGFWPRLSVP